MTRRIGACLVMSLLIGCGVGGGGGDGFDDPEDLDPNPNKLTCSDAFKISGSFVESEPRPADVAGCWAVGTWTFTVSRDPGEDNVLDITGDQKPDRCGAVSGTTAATSETNFVFQVTLEGDPEIPGDSFEKYALEGQTIVGERTQWNGKLVEKMKVTEGGSGECEAGIELISMDGKSEWNVKPSLAGTTLTGIVDFALYQDSQL